MGSRKKYKASVEVVSKVSFFFCHYRLDLTLFVDWALVPSLVTVKTVWSLCRNTHCSSKGSYTTSGLMVRAVMDKTGSSFACFTGPALSEREKLTSQLDWEVRFLCWSQKVWPSLWVWSRKLQTGPLPRVDTETLQPFEHLFPGSI